MGRVTIAILWMVVAGSARAAYIEGTLTLDDARAMNLTMRHFRSHRVNGPAGEDVTTRVARFRCSGEACFTPMGGLGYELPFRGSYWVAFDDPAHDPRHYSCVTIRFDLKRHSCRIRSRVTCNVLDTSLGPPFVDQTIATGMLDVHRTTPSCQRPSGY